MSPITGSPNRGYADWQRVSNWDNTPFDSNLVLPINGTVSTPVTDCSRFAYIGGFARANTHPILLTLSWYTDAAGVNQVGLRQLSLDHRITNANQFRVPNLGPYVQAVWQPNVTNGGLLTDTLFLTNRFHPLEFIPQKDTLLNVNNFTVNNGVTDTRYPTDLYAGPIQVWTTVPATGWGLTMWHGISDAISTQAYGEVLPVNNSVRTLVTPPTSWFLQVLNGSGANGAYSINVQHSETGAM